MCLWSPLFRKATFSDGMCCYTVVVMYITCDWVMITGHTVEYRERLPSILSPEAGLDWDEKVGSAIWLRPAQRRQRKFQRLAKMVKNGQKMPEMSQDCPNQPQTEQPARQTA